MQYLQHQGHWRLLLLVMLMPLALIAFWPSPVDAPVRGQLSDILQFLQRHGIAAWFTYQIVEATANVVLFLPVGFMASLAYPEKRWWQIMALGLVMSSSIELGQLLFLHNRFASPSDLVTNTGGAVIGCLLALLALKRLRARSQYGGPVEHRYTLG